MGQRVWRPPSPADILTQRHRGTVESCRVASVKQCSSRSMSGITGQRGVARGGESARVCECSVAATKLFFLTEYYCFRNYLSQRVTENIESKTSESSVTLCER